MIALTIKTPAATEPVSVADLRAHARLDDNGDDADLERIITHARAWSEAFTGRTFIKTVFTLTLDAWPSKGVVALPCAPALTVDAVRVLDAAYTPTVVASSAYRLVGQDLVPLDTWPAPGATYGGIEIDFSAGYGTTGAEVPAGITGAILKAAAFLNENRESQPFESGAGAMLAPYKRLFAT